MYRSGSLWIPTHYSLPLVGQTMGGRGAELENGHMLTCAFPHLHFTIANAPQI